MFAHLYQNSILKNPKAIFTLLIIAILSFGYYSKDLILEFIFLSNHPLKLFSFSIGVFGVLLTSIYSSRLLIHVFHRENLSDEKVFAHIHESPPIMIFPLIILAIFSIFFGMF